MANKKNKIIKWLVKEHNIKIGLEGKLIILLLAIIIWVYIIPMCYLQNIQEAFDEEMFLICSYAIMYECDDLQVAYPYCMDAQRWFDAKNCTWDNSIRDRRLLFQPLADSKR